MFELILDLFMILMYIFVRYFIKNILSINLNHLNIKQFIYIHIPNLSFLFYSIHISLYYYTFNLIRISIY